MFTVKKKPLRQMVFTEKSQLCSARMKKGTGYPGKNGKAGAFLWFPTAQHRTV
jgi:hypothetical protein